MITTRSGRWALAASLGLTLAAGVWSVLRIGPWPLPDLQGFVDRIGSWRSASLPESLRYVRENLPFQLIYEALGSGGVWRYLVQWAATLVIALGLLCWWYADSAGPGRRLLGVRLALLSPIVAVFVGFVGSYDPITVIGAVAMLWAWKANSRFWMVASGALLGFQHFPQGLPMVLAVGLVAWALGLESDEFRRRLSFFWAVPGLILGKVICLLVLLVATGSASGDRMGALSWDYIRPQLVSAVNFWPVFLLSMFAGAWVIIALCFFDLPMRGRIALGCSFLIALAPSVIFGDHTRIFVLLSLPSLALMTRWLLARPTAIPHQWAVIELLAWVVVPLLLWTSSGSAGVGYVQHTGALDQLIMFFQTARSWH